MKYIRRYERYMKKEISFLSQVGGQQHQSLGASYNGGMFCILSMLESLIYKINKSLTLGEELCSLFSAVQLIECFCQTYVADRETDKHTAVFILFVTKTLVRIGLNNCD